ncbi:MAG: bifunctional diguanylate cyclase/phosphodiesterase [Acidimicrobiales bacterium]|nr:bifunctional diguanylate cyclase/phosphodiesterase [Acidimicrobiales bacterium]
MISATLRISGRSAWLLIAVGLAVCWGTTLVLGGEAHVPPHLFYIPIVFAGVRFGLGGSLLTAIASGVIAGPLTPADVALHTAQPFSSWGTRAVFFILIGQALTAIATITTSTMAAELADLRGAKALWSALDQDRFEVYFQPIVSLATGNSVVGAEALVRLNDRDRGVVCPDDFIPLAERTGMIRAIGVYVLRSACAHTVGWQQRALVGPDFMLSVNVSARELDAPAYAARVGEVLDETGLDPACLQLEITETALADDPRVFLDTLHDLRRLGVRIAIDDFGIGQSTLAEVQRIPADVIKIDKAFVATLGDGANGSAIAANVLSLAVSLGLVPVAEGVETDEQAAILTKLGCDLAQGYFFSRPIPSARFELLLGLPPVRLTSPGSPASRNGCSDAEEVPTPEHGVVAFTVPGMGEFIQRQPEPGPRPDRTST